MATAYSQGLKFKKALQVKCKRQGFFDWHIVERDHSIFYQFYWDKISKDYIDFLSSFIKENENYSPILTGGIHDDSEKFQVMLQLTIMK